METATKTVEQMSESFAQPDTQERFSEWAERSEKEARQEEKEHKKHAGPREIELKGAEPEWREWVEAVGEKDQSTKESPRRNEQRADGEKSAGDSTNSHVEPKQDKLAGTELDNHWRQISAAGNPAWQKATPMFQAELVKVLGGVDNQKDVMQFLAAHPEVLHNVKDVPGLQAAVHQVSARESMSAEVKQATVRHPDAADKIRSATTEIMAEKTPLFVKAFVNDSEVIGELLYTLADPTTLGNLLETAKTNPGKALRALRDMEIDIKRALSNEKASEVRPRPRAPRPPVALPARSAAGDDGTLAAGNWADFDRRQSQRYAHAR